jgi:malate dehydrogenase (oxaloacetate-decarboxylating)
VNYNEMALKLHKDNVGKIEITSKVQVENKTDLSTAYTPGVAEPCMEIYKNIDTVYDYTAKSNLVAVVTDGTAVLGLGDIGAHASIPVMEGKAVLFKSFANVDAFPICLNTKDTEEIIRTIKLLEPVFGGINLEDISAPRCFEIEKRLKEELDIPVFHDDQHGTAIVVAAAIINSLKVTGKKIENIEAVINGAGSAGIAIAKLLLSMGIKNIIMCDIEGILSSASTNLDDSKKEILSLTNKDDVSGTLLDAMKNKDVFIGVSAPGVVTKDMIASLNEKSIVFPMANPTPEIMPDLALEAGAYIVGTGRSDFPNQVNNVLAFPGIFRGALDVRASEINEEMKIAAAYAIARTVKDNELSKDFILPEAFNKDTGINVAEAVRKAAVDSGVARI